MSSTSSVIATAKMPSVNASMRCLDRPTGSTALPLRRVTLPPLSSCGADGDRARPEAAGELPERDPHTVDLEDACAQNPGRTVIELRARTRVGRRDRSYEIVNRRRIARPVDDAVLR